MSCEESKVSTKPPLVCHCQIWVQVWKLRVGSNLWTRLQHKLIRDLVTNYQKLTNGDACVLFAVVD